MNYALEKQIARLGIFEFFGGCGSFAQTPENEATKAPYVGAPSMGLVVVDAVAEGSPRVIAEASQLNVVRLSTTWHFWQTPTGLSRIVARRTHAVILPYR